MTRKLINNILPNLDNYLDYEPTQNCYLDGRYFNLVFESYPGLIDSYLNICFDLNDNSLTQSVVLNKNFKYKPIHGINILRVIIEFNKIKHSAAIIFDVSDDNNIKAYFFDSSKILESNKIANHIILSTIKDTLGLKYNVELISPDINLEVNSNCTISGFCLAYTIKFIYDYLLGRSFDFQNIRKFAACIEDYFGPLDPNFAEPEYGPGDDFAFGALAGFGLGSMFGGYGYGYPIIAPIPIYGGYGYRGGYRGGRRR